MALTDEQKATLKAYIENDATLNAFPNTLDGAFAIADLLNLVANPAFYAWKTSVSTDDAIDVLVWTEYLILDLNKRQTFEFMLSNHDFNPSRLNIRQGIAACLPVSEADGCRNALLAIAAEPVTVIEQIFATGTGSQASPATRSFYGMISYQDVYAARNYTV